MTQSQKRFTESMASLFQTNKKLMKKNHSSKKSLSALFLTSSSDIGVIRNGGRNGSRYAPQSILAQLKKMTLSSKIPFHYFFQEEISSTNLEREDFVLSQQKESEKISQLLSNFHPHFLAQIGGGHDHIYSLVKSISQNYAHVIIINIDAHADTRDDQYFSSGTPFRQLSLDLREKMHLFQIGLNRFANSSSTLSPFNQGHQDYLWLDDFNSLDMKEQQKIMKLFFQKISSLMNTLSEKQNFSPKSSVVIFSLDSDALEGSEMLAVSAPNPLGISFQQLSYLWHLYLQLPLCHSPVLGLYEFNPLYDNTSALYAKKLAAFIYYTLQRNHFYNNENGQVF